MGVDIGSSPIIFVSPNGSGDANALQMIQTQIPSPYG